MTWEPKEKLVLSTLSLEIYTHLFNNTVCSKHIVYSQDRSVKADHLSTEGNKFPPMMGFLDWNSPCSNCNALNPWVLEEAISFCLTGRWLCNLLKLFFSPHCSRGVQCWRVRPHPHGLVNPLILSPVQQIFIENLPSIVIWCFIMVYRWPEWNFTRRMWCLFAVPNCIDIRADPHSVGL